MKREVTTRREKWSCDDEVSIMVLTLIDKAAGFVLVITDHNRNWVKDISLVTEVYMQSRNVSGEKGDEGNLGGGGGVWMRGT